MKIKLERKDSILNGIICYEKGRPKTITMYTVKS